MEPISERVSAVIGTPAPSGGAIVPLYCEGVRSFDRQGQLRLALILHKANVDLYKQNSRINSIKPSLNKTLPRRGASWLLALCMKSGIGLIPWVPVSKMLKCHHLSWMVMSYVS